MEGAADRNLRPDRGNRRVRPGDDGRIRFGRSFVAAGSGRRTSPTGGMVVGDPAGADAFLPAERDAVRDHAGQLPRGQRVDPLGERLPRAGDFASVARTGGMVRRQASSGGDGRSAGVSRSSAGDRVGELHRGPVGEPRVVFHAAGVRGLPVRSERRDLVAARHRGVGDFRGRGRDQGERREPRRRARADR